MFKTTKKVISILVSVFVLSIALFSCQNHNEYYEKEGEEKGYDGPVEMMEQVFDQTQDPSLHRIPTERMMTAREITRSLDMFGRQTTSGYGNWVERGPDSDVAGVSGNARGSTKTGGATSGRIRAVLVDAADPSFNTVIVGSVSGGLWRSTNFTSSNYTWTPVDEQMKNLAITSLVQDPSNLSIIYCSTGEAYYNADATKGEGVYKSTDGGLTWAMLPSTSGSEFNYTTKMVCDYLGNIYLGTRSGLKRSTDKGITWTTITPAGMSSRIADVDISSTTAPGRLFVTGGIFTTQSFMYCDNPAAASPTFVSPATPFPSYNMRAEVACSGNVLYALPVNNYYEVPTIYKSVDGGANWATTTTATTYSLTNGQGWYDLTAVINPSNSNEVIIGGLDNWRSVNGGGSWSQISYWATGGVNYCHADQQNAVWYDNGNKLISTNDGGIFYSTDKGSAYVSRNVGLRIKQFYSVAMHPTAGTNYFLAGAQDNGTHQITSAGIGGSVEVTGGDGGFVHIDQNQPQYQITSYVYNQFRKNATSGTNTWTNANLSSSTGRFINPTDYDDNFNVVYSSSSAGTYRRWTNPQSTTTPISEEVVCSGLGTNMISAVTISPFTSNRVYMGTSGSGPSKLIYVNNAKLAASPATGIDITPPGIPTGGYISCINFGSTENNIITTLSNFGVNNLYVSTNGGTAWTQVDGNLPDMPVYWVMFDPTNDLKAIIATELGVWTTDNLNGANTAWLPSPGFPQVKSTMMQYRSSDGLLAVSTYGRGLWTQSANTVLPISKFEMSAAWVGNGARVKWSLEATDPGTGKFVLQSSVTGNDFADVVQMNRSHAIDYQYDITNISSVNIFFRIKFTEIDGKVTYTNVEKLSNNKNAKKEMSIVNIYPNPVKSSFTVNYYAPVRGVATYTIMDVNGRVVLSGRNLAAYQGNITFVENVNTLPAGTYILSIKLNDETSKQKFVKL